MLSKTIDVYKNQTGLEGLLSLIAEGKEIIFTKDDNPVARLVPIKKRKPGLHAGAIWTSEDFDEPLPEELILI